MVVTPCFRNLTLSRNIDGGRGVPQISTKARFGHTKEASTKLSQPHNLSLVNDGDATCAFKSGNMARLSSLMHKESS